jgi:hypothetical protein
MVEGIPRESKAVARIVSVNARVSMMTSVDLVKSKKLDNGTEGMESNRQRGERGRLERDEGESAQRNHPLRVGLFIRFVPTHDYKSLSESLIEVQSECR